MHSYSNSLTNSQTSSSVQLSSKPTKSSTSTTATPAMKQYQMDHYQSSQSQTAATTSSFPLYKQAGSSDSTSVALAACISHTPQSLPMSLSSHNQEQQQQRTAGWSSTSTNQQSMGTKFVFPNPLLVQQQEYFDGIAAAASKEKSSTAKKLTNTITSLNSQSNYNVASTKQSSYAYEPHSMFSSPATSSMLTPSPQLLMSSSTSAIRSSSQPPVEATITGSSNGNSNTLQPSSTNIQQSQQYITSSPQTYNVPRQNSSQINSPVQMAAPSSSGGVGGGGYSSQKPTATNTTNSLKKNLTINTVEVQQTYNFPGTSLLPTPHTNKQQQQQQQQTSATVIAAAQYENNQNYMEASATSHALYENYSDNSGSSKLNKPQSASTKKSLNLAQSQPKQQSSQPPSQQPMQHQYARPKTAKNSSTAAATTPVVGTVSSKLKGGNSQVNTATSQVSLLSKQIGMSPQPTSSSSANSSQLSILKQLSPKYQQQVLKYDNNFFGGITGSVNNNAINSNSNNHYARQLPLVPAVVTSTVHSSSQQISRSPRNPADQTQPVVATFPLASDPFFLSPKHPKSQPQSTKSQSGKTGSSQQQQQQQQQQSSNGSYFEFPSNSIALAKITQSAVVDHTKSSKNTPINLILQKQHQESQGQATSTNSRGYVQGSTTLAAKKKKSQLMSSNQGENSGGSVTGIDGKSSSSNFKQNSSTRDTSLQKLQQNNADLHQVLKRTQTVLRNFQTEKNLWMQEKHLILSELHSLRTRLSFYQQNSPHQTLDINQQLESII